MVGKAVVVLEVKELVELEEALDLAGCSAKV